MHPTLQRGGLPESNCGCLQVFGRVRSGQGSGTIGILTGGVLTRTQYYEHTMALALVPFLNPALYGKEFELGSS